MQCESPCQEKYSSSNPVGSEHPASTSPSRSPPPVLWISHHYLLLCLDYLPLPSLNLQRSQKLKYISVTFCGPLSSFPLTLDSCCSVSLGCKAQADFIASKRPNLRYCSWEEPISLTPADPKSHLKAVATIEIPFTWENASETIFTMLVVPGLV